MSEHRWFRVLPEWLVSWRADWLRPDIVAGLITGAVIIPKAMAYAMMAGLPVQVVQVGLYTALVPMVIYAVLGTSRVLSVSTTTTLGGSRTFAGVPAAPGNRGERCSSVLEPASGWSLWWNPQPSHF